MFCKEQVAQLRDVTEEIHFQGAELIIVGSGTPEQAGWFIEDYEMTTPVFTDPSLAAYNAVGARRGVLTLLHPKAFLNRFVSLCKGYRQSRTMGSATQQGAVLLVMPDGSIPYRYISTASGDHPKPMAVLEALKTAARRG